MPGMTERVYPKEIDKGNELHQLVIGIFIERYEIAREWISEWMPKRPLRILDIACGSGYGADILSSLGTVVGVDIDPEVIEYANKHYKSDNVEFMIGSATDEAFLDTLGTFDIVVSMSTLEHIDAPEVFLGWIRKNLSADGIAIFNFPAMVTRDWAGDHHARDIPARRADAFMHKHGFRIEKRYIRKDRIPHKQMAQENRENSELPTPKLRQFIRYYLGHPHHLLLRVYQIVVLGGFYFSGQQYLIVPSSRPAKEARE